MSTLRSGLEELAAEDVRLATDEELEAGLVEIERAVGVLEAERARRVAELARRGTYARDGYLSPTAWLAHRLRVAAQAAARYLRWARALERLPGTHRALAEGGITLSAAAVLVAAAEAHPEHIGEGEPVLLQAARTLSVRDLRRAVAYWGQLVDAEALEREAEERHQRRRLYVSPTLGGMVRVDGDLDPETGQVLISALRAITDAEARAPGDRRSPAERRADALGEICRAYLERPDRPAVGGERPQLTLTVDLQVLQGRGPGRCELEDVGPISPEQARRLACDAQLVRVITAGGSQPLDVGRRTPVVPAPLRRAVVLRDGGCRFPGCGRPPGWCDAHHVVHWARGGRTALDNLVLLCRPHHRMLHRGFGVRMVQGRPVFTRPDGSVLEDRAPP